MPLILHKTLGETPLACMERYRKEHAELVNQPMTYAGRLDPMATGALLVLTGEECKKKDDYLGLDKTYVAEILFGVKTDSADLLGLPRIQQSDTLREAEVKAICDSMIGSIDLRLPVFSSPPVNGKPLHEWARLGKLASIEVPVRTMRIHEVRLQSVRTISADELRNYVSQTIPLVSGDFRQKEIMDAWNSVLRNDILFTLAKIRLRVGSGTYIRAIAEEFGKRLGTEACLFSLHRSAIGDFEVRL